MSRPAASRRATRSPADRARTVVAGLAVLVTGAVLFTGATLVLNVRNSSVPGRTPTADGYIGDARVGIDDDQLPAIAKLDPALRTAVRVAAAAARAEGITFRVTSGWRSRAYQRQLLDEAIGRYGSAAEAARWVSTPDASRHVVGAAIDIGPSDAALWLARHGPAYGLCQVYANEIWHYELLTVPGGTCPRLRQDGAS